MLDRLFNRSKTATDAGLRTLSDEWNDVSTPELLVKQLNPRAAVPQTQRPGDAGLDLSITHDLLVGSAPVRAHTGIAVAIPEGYVGLICPRSGLAMKHAVTVTNAPGVIDSNYRGELIVLLNTTDDRYFHVAAGDRIAQLILVPCIAPLSTIVDVLPTNDDRGAAGFGSSGR